MFDALSGRLTGIFDKLKRRGALSEQDVRDAMREIRVALLAADVALPVVKDFIARVSEKSVGRQVLRSVTPGQQIVKIVHDEMLAMLGEASEQIDLAAAPPVAVLMVGLQGSGKTTTTGKLARRFRERQGKKVLLASLDTRRPAAQEQLAILAEKVGVDSLPIIAGQQPVEIARRALTEARLGGYDVVMLDTAGRFHIDDELMDEVVAVRDAVTPAETLLVVDAMTGQDSVNVAQSFNEKVGITGIVLTRIDGDARGGAALSMRAVTGRPIKLLGTGEKLEALEPFHPDRVASRILGMGDVVSLVEKAAETIQKEEAEQLLEKFVSGQYDLNDLKTQLQQMTKMGGMSGIMKLMPGMGKMEEAMKGAKVDDSFVKRQIAIIDSMTVKERRWPKLMNAKRKKRVASGSGTSVQEINKLLKQHEQMALMMKKMKKMGGKSLFGGLGGMLGGGMGGLGGGLGKMLGGMPDPAELQKMAAGLGGGGDMPDLSHLLDAKGLPDAAKLKPGDLKALQDMLKGRK
jgi:signal recognition particle subunit SRP54